MMTTQQVILVDEHDTPIGEMEKLAAHQQGLCHRAFSVFLFRKHRGQRQTLLQQRQADKYHAGGLWSNACCSHPQPSQTNEDAAHTRLQFELGINAQLTYVDKFHYIACFENGLTENEVDHVFVGHYDGHIDRFNSAEVSAATWMDIDTLLLELTNHPDQYTPWLAQALAVALLD